MDGYMFLSPSQAHQVRVNRLQELESEHFYALLRLEEDPKDKVMQQTLVELERRIKHHVQALTPEDPEQNQAPTESSENTSVAVPD